MNDPARAQRSARLAIPGFWAGILLIVLAGGGARAITLRVVETRLAEKNRAAAAWAATAGDSAPAPTNDLSRRSEFLFPDSEDFDSYARSLAFPAPADVAAGLAQPRDRQGRQFWRTPLYSRLLAGWYAVAGPGVAGARWLNILLDLAGIALAGLAARRLSEALDWSRARLAGLAAAGLYALDPWGALFSTLILADTAGAVLTLLATWLAAEWVCRRRLRAPGWLTLMLAVAAGGACGLAALAKPALGLLAAGFVIFAAAGRWRGRRAILEAAAAAGRNGEPGKKPRPPERHPEKRRDGMPAASPVPTAAAPASGRGVWRRVAGGSLWVLLGFFLAMMPWWLKSSRLLAPEFVPLSTMDGFVWWETAGPGADGGANFGKTPFPVAWLAWREALAGDVWRDHPLRSAPPDADGQPAYYSAYRLRYHWAAGRGSERTDRPTGSAPAGEAPYILASVMLPRGQSIPSINDFSLDFDLEAVHSRGGWIRADWNRDSVDRATAAARFEWRANEMLRENLTPTLRQIGDPDAAAKLIRQAPAKLGRLWNPFPNWRGAAEWGRWTGWVSALSFAAVVLLAVKALATTRGAWRLAWVYLVPALYLSGVHLIMLSSARYRLPAWGGLCVLAGLGLSLLWDAAKQQLAMRNEE